jgi:hypothetical protein
MPMNDVPCPSCGARCFPEEKICPSCGVDIDQVASEIARQIPPKKYPTLRVRGRVKTSLAAGGFGCTAEKQDISSPTCF